MTPISNEFSITVPNIFNPKHKENCIGVLRMYIAQRMSDNNLMHEIRSNDLLDPILHRKRDLLSIKRNNEMFKSLS